PRAGHRARPSFSPDVPALRPVDEPAVKAESVDADAVVLHIELCHEGDIARTHESQWFSSRPADAGRIRLEGPGYGWSQGGGANRLDRSYPITRLKVETGQMP